MKKLLFIFVIAFQGCEKMTVSEALPIQFWPISGQTFNEKVNAYVDKQCFTQEFDCNDNVKLQVYTDGLETPNNYNLKVLDVAGATLETVAFSKTLLPYGATLDFDNGDFTSNPLGVSAFNFDGSNRSANVPFAFSSGIMQAVASSETNKQNTKYLAFKRVDTNASLGWPPGSYTIRVRVKNNSSGATDDFGLTAWGMVDGTGQTSLSATSSPSSVVNDNTYRDVDLSFTTSQYWTYLAIAATRLGGGGTYNIACYFDSVHIISSVKDFAGENNLSFSAISLPTSICDAFVRFIIQQNGVDVLKSDYIKFNSSISFNQGHGSFLIAYKSAKNFAGISYPNDGSYFYLRIPARFFQQRNNSKQSSLELSNSKVINTSVILKLQQLMVTTLLPDYMHNKLQLALSHGVRGSLLIDGLEWTLEENYERNSPDAKSPFQFGKVWLTRKNHLVRNII